MSTPYWGQLPGPKVTQPTHAGHYRRRSESDDNTYNADRRSSMDAPPVRRTTNRTSALTHVTDLQSESTFSPHDSPSTFAGQGLAPRPPSYQPSHAHPPNTDPSDLNTYRRPGRNRVDYNATESPSFSTAPEAPGAHQVSYHHTYDNGGIPYTHTTSGVPVGHSQLPDPTLESENYDMAPDNYYQSSTGRMGDPQYPGGATGDNSRRDSTASAMDTYALSRRATTGTSSDRRRNMTKEEKRARVEAAERRARERAALRAGKRPADSATRTHNRHLSVSHGRRPSASDVPVAARQPPMQRQVPSEIPQETLREVSRDPPRELPRDISIEVPRESSREDYREPVRSIPKEVPVQREYSTRHREPLSQHPPEEANFYSSGALQEPEEIVPAQSHVNTDSGIPKRNLSFRERAARENVHFAEPLEPKATASQPAPNSRFSLTRSGSNKLKKEPPGDPWYRMKQDLAAKQQQSLEQSHHDTHDYQPSQRDKELSPSPADPRRPSVDVGSRPTYVPMLGDSQSIHRRVTEPIRKVTYDHDEEYVSPVARSKTLTKAEKDPGEPPEVVAARRRAERTESFSSDDDGSHHHRFSNMVFKPREQMTPGDGLYKPLPWLDEWKKGTVGTLSGTLLDIQETPKDNNHWAPADQNNAWWEQDDRRRSYPSRPRKAEAFDGEYDENAPTRFKPPLYLKCGPLLRYCGTRREKAPPRTQQPGAISQGLVLDLQDVFGRFTYDTTSILVSGADPACLSVEFPEVRFIKAMDDAERAILFRHVVPESCWKLQRSLAIGEERQLSQAWATLDQFIAKDIAAKREKLSNIPRTNMKKEDEDVDLLTSYMGDEEIGGLKSDKFLRDTILNFMIAGKDTTAAALTWFVWLVCQNPLVETKILDELTAKIPERKVRQWRVFDADELVGLVYLHGALCESLRLFPPVPFQHKSPISPDVLPTGHEVRPGTKILLSLYAMGRMENIWGKDCLEFKPERWISEQGGIKHEPSYKFMAFNAGPRTCLGKEIAFTQMKAVAAAIIYNYHVQVEEGHLGTPNHSLILQMKHGLKVRITKRWL